MLLNCVILEMNHLFCCMLSISSSVSELQNLVTACEKVLLDLDMSLNAGKSCCMPIGSRFDKPCANVCTHDGRQLS